MIKKILCSTLLSMAFLTSSAYSNTCTDNLSKHISNEVKGLLDLQLCGLHDSDMPQVAKFLLEHTDIDSINLYRNSITDEGLKPLSTIATLKKLDLSANEGIRGYHLDNLIALIKLQQLTTLNLSSDGIYSIYSEEVINALAHNTSIKELTLNDCKLSSDVIVTLAKNMSALEVLSAKNNEISADGAIALSKNPKIVKINLSGNKIGDMGATALSYTPNLIYLNLDKNLINDIGAKALAKSNKLQILSLASNGIGDLGSEELATNTKLFVLNLKNNKVQDKGAIALANNTTLKELDVSYNKINNTGLSALIANQNFEKLSIEGNVSSKLFLANTK